MSHRYAWPINVPLPRGGFDLCNGPEILGTPLDFGTRWAVWTATDGIRFGIWNGEVMEDTLGAVNGLFDPGVRPSKVAMCFDPDGNQMIAIQQDPTTIAVRKFVTGTPTEFTFAGLSPVLFNTFEASRDNPDFDVYVIYIKAGGDELFVRSSSEDFANEYSLNAGLNTVIVELMKTDVVETENFGDSFISFFQALWAMDNQGRVVYFHSQFYRSEGGSS